MTWRMATAVATRARADGDSRRPRRRSRHECARARSFRYVTQSKLFESHRLQQRQQRQQRQHDMHAARIFRFALGERQSGGDIVVGSRSWVHRAVVVTLCCSFGGANGYVWLFVEDDGDRWSLLASTTTFLPALPLGRLQPINPFLLRDPPHSPFLSIPPPHTNTTREYTRTHDFSLYTRTLSPTHTHITHPQTWWLLSVSIWEPPTPAWVFSEMTASRLLPTTRATGQLPLS